MNTITNETDDEYISGEVLSTTDAGPHDWKTYLAIGAMFALAFLGFGGCMYLSGLGHPATTKAGQASMSVHDNTVLNVK